MRAALAAALILFAAVAAAAPLDSAPADGTMTFDVMREGSRIGTHRIVVRRDGDELIVESSLDVAVKVVMITVYRYRSTRVETWRGGALVAYRAETDDDGNDLVVVGRAGLNGFMIEGPRGAYTLPADAMPNNLWNGAAVAGAPLFDPDDGTPMRVAVADRGSSPPPGGGTPARHYHLTGDTDTELWFVGNRPVGVRIKGRDGSLIDYLPG